MNDDVRDPNRGDYDRMSALDKIEWMIATNGWALEPVLPRSDLDPPVPAYAYTIGFAATFGFPEVLLFGLTPVASNGLVGLVADMLRGGTEIPLGTELVGLFDNDLRCAFAPVDVDEWGGFMPVATSWYKGADYQVVQLLWPDRNGFMPNEVGYDQRMVLAQPVIGTIR